MIQRQIQPHILLAFGDTPAIFLNGARQTGKSTLVRSLIAAGHPATYLSFDDLTTLHAARTDPQGFVAGLPRFVALDEVQRVPEILLPIKAAIDSDRAGSVGRFLLTGSANILLLPNLADSLAGRMEIFTLYGLAEMEIEPREREYSWIEAAFSGNVSDCIPKTPLQSALSLEERLCRSGFPEVLGRAQASRRSAWFSSYISTMLERDVRDLARIDSVTHLPRVLSLCAARTSSILNFSEFSRTTQLPQTTLKRYMNLLTMLFFIIELPAWSVNFGKRLTKAPKLYVADTGLAAYLLGADVSRLRENRMLFGQLLETFVVMELKKQNSWLETPVRMFHLHAQSGLEIDIILENFLGEIVAVEVKATSSVSGNDSKSLRTFAALQGDKLKAGILLYQGETVVPLGEKLWAVPISSLL